MVAHHSKFRRKQAREKKRKRNRHHILVFHNTGGERLGYHNKESSRLLHTFFTTACVVLTLVLLSSSPRNTSALNVNHNGVGSSELSGLRQHSQRIAQEQHEQQQRANHGASFDSEVTGSTDAKQEDKVQVSSRQDSNPVSMEMNQPTVLPLTHDDEDCPCMWVVLLEKIEYEVASDPKFGDMWDFKVQVDNKSAVEFPYKDSITGNKRKLAKGGIRVINTPVGCDKEDKKCNKNVKHTVEILAKELPNEGVHSEKFDLEFICDGRDRSKNLDFPFSKPKQPLASGGKAEGSFTFFFQIKTACVKKAEPPSAPSPSGVISPSPEGSVVDPSVPIPDGDLVPAPAIAPAAESSPVFIDDDYYIDHGFECAEPETVCCDECPCEVIDGEGRELAVSFVSCFTTVCAAWICINAAVGMGWLAALPNCPCVIARAGAAALPGWNAPLNASDFFHPGSSHCMRSIGGPGLVPGQQCCYDAAGKLITGGKAAGTPDYVAPDDAAGIAEHFCADVVPWFSCSWQTYNHFRPPNNGNSCPVNVVNPF